MQKNKIALYIALFILALGLFYFVSQNETVQIQMPVMDSTSTSERPVITAQKDTIPQPAGEDLSPGSALIKATILSVEYRDEKPDKMQLLVQQVLGYGSTTPVIGSETKLMVNIENFIKANPEQKKNIQEDTNIQAQVSYQQFMAIGDSASNIPWKLRSLKTLFNEDSNK